MNRKNNVSFRVISKSKLVLVLCACPLVVAAQELPTLKGLTKLLEANSRAFTSANVQVEEDFTFATNPTQKKTYQWNFDGNKLFRQEALANGMTFTIISDGNRERFVFSKQSLADLTKSQVQEQKPAMRGGISPLSGAWESHGQRWCEVLRLGKFSIVGVGSSAYGQTIKVAGADNHGRSIEVEFAHSLGYLATSCKLISKFGDGSANTQVDAFELLQSKKIEGVFVGTLARHSTEYVYAKDGTRVWAHSSILKCAYEDINSVGDSQFRVAPLPSGSRYTDGDSQRQYRIGPGGTAFEIGGAAEARQIANTWMFILPVGIAACWAATVLGKRKVRG